MTHVYFNIRYEFDREMIHKRIAQQVASGTPDYVCVADGVIMMEANKNPDYLSIINDGMFCICDSSYVPLYIRWIYGEHNRQYTGSAIFRDVIASRKYRMAFMGSSHEVLEGLRESLMDYNPDVADMLFYELPFLNVDEFNYPEIAAMLDRDGAQIIWVALGAPKQEIFMSKLKPFLSRGVIIAVGAAFKFYSNAGVKRAPKWMRKHHMEFVHRIWTEPKKQIKRCALILGSLPGSLISEWRRKKQNESHTAH